MEQIRTALYDAGVKDKDVALFLNHFKLEQYEPCIQILSKIRKQELEDLHTKQQELERLDYLLYVLKNNKINEI